MARKSNYDDCAPAKPKNTGMLGSPKWLPSRSAKSALFHGLEEMIVVVVGDLPAHGDSRCLVEGPVNTEVDAALTVILFRFGKAGERRGIRGRILPWLSSVTPFHSSDVNVNVLLSVP